MLQHYVEHRWRGYQVMSTRKSDWLKAFCYVTPLREMLQEACRHSAIVACNVVEVELASTPVTLRTILHATIAKVDTRCI